MRILAIIGTLLIGILLIVVGAVGATWYAKRELQVPAAETAPQSPAPRTAARTGAKELQRPMLSQLLALVDAERRNAILDSGEVFARFVEQERANQAVLAAAYANSADENPAVDTLMLRASQKILAETYLNEVVRRNLDATFPSAEQVRQFYDANKESFRLPDRVHLWQIFVAAPKSNADTDEAAANSVAQTISKQLKSKEKSFAVLAAEHSQHIQSRVNDGYMGLLKTADLLPEIKAQISDLAPDELSPPIRTDAGFHLIKRGEMVAGSQLEFEAVQRRIVVQMKREAAARVRQAAVKKILETYPVAVDTSKLEDWRTGLQTADWSAGAPP